MSRVIFWLLSLALFPIYVCGQSFYQPEVMLNAPEINEASKRDLERLEEQLQMMLLNYAPPVDLALTPKQPIRVFVLVNIKEVQLSEYRGDLEIAVYRPIYDKEEESLVMLIGERDVSFSFNPQLSPSFIGQELPTETLPMMVYYYVTLGAMYYYDSFSLYGGSPFLKFLEERKTLFQEAWQRGGALSLNRESRYAPREFLPELQTIWGDQFRELWYIYHREGLDAQDDGAYMRVLGTVLQTLRSMQLNNASLGFIPFFSDTKRGEMRVRLMEDKNLNSTRVKTLAEELFPNITGTL